MDTEYADLTGHHAVNQSLAMHNKPVLPAENQATTDEMQLGFRIGAIGFLLPVSLHCEVIERSVINAIPNVKPWFSGLLNNRGNIIPDFDLSLLLGESINPSQKRYLFAIDRGDKTIALWIDGYPKLLNGIGQPVQMSPSLPEWLQNNVNNAYQHENQVWLKVRYEQLFASLGKQVAIKGQML